MSIRLKSNGLPHEIVPMGKRQIFGTEATSSPGLLLSLKKSERRFFLEREEALGRGWVPRLVKSQERYILSVSENRKYLMWRRDC